MKETLVLNSYYHRIPIESPAYSQMFFKSGSYMRPEPRNLTDAVLPLARFAETMAEEVGAGVQVRYELQSACQHVHEPWSKRLMKAASRVLVLVQRPAGFTHEEF